MEQRPLYEALTHAGFQVLEFSDHPASFGSWFVSVKWRHTRFRLAYDGRDGSLSLQQANAGADWVDLQTQKAPPHEGGLITLGLSWLQDRIRV